MTNQISAVETAKIVRQELKKLFPQTKFSIRTTHNSMRVGWTDGESEREVRNVVEKYKGMYYDMNEDLWKYSAGKNYATDYISTNRQFSVEFLTRMIKAVGEYWGNDVSNVEVKMYGQDSQNAYVFSPSSPEIMRQTNRWSMAELASERAHETNALNGKRYDWFTGNEIE